MLYLTYFFIICEILLTIFNDSYYSRYREGFVYIYKY